MYIHHITLNTGHASRIRPGDVSGETLARVGPWLAALVQSGQSAPLPVSDLADYTAHATAQNGALVVTISAPAGLPLVTMGVAVRSRHAIELWDGLVQLAKANKPQRPSAPWAAVVLWPSLSAHPEAAEWLGDLERCVAWAWRNTHDR